MHESAPPVTATPGIGDSPDQISYDPATAAAKLGISRRQIYNLFETGEIPSFKVGTSRRVSREDLLAFVARKKQESAA